VASQKASKLARFRIRQGGVSPLPQTLTTTPRRLAGPMYSAIATQRAAVAAVTTRATSSVKRASTLKSSKTSLGCPSPSTRLTRRGQSTTPRAGESEIMDQLMAMMGGGKAGMAGRDATGHWRAAALFR
jgi:hypothetical protein